MPIIQGADMTSVSTDREPFPEGSYTVTVKESELAEDNKSVTIKSRIDSADDPKFVDREFWHYINLVQKDGKTNQIGLQTIKKYTEAVFGKGSPESNQNDTDVLNGHTVQLYMTVREYKDKDGNDRKANDVKKIFAA